MHDEDKVEKPATAIDEIRRISKLRLEQCNAELAELADHSAKIDARREVLGSEIETFHRILDASLRDDEKDVKLPRGYTIDLPYKAQQFTPNTGRFVG